MKSKLFINKKVWESFSEDELEEYVEQVFQYYRERAGFPFFRMTTNKAKDVVEKLRAFDTDRLVDGDNLKQFMLGLNLVNLFMRHMWEVKCHGFKSPMETFDNDDMLRKAIRKRMGLGDNMSDAGMRKALSWTHGTHRVSNFRPTVAKYIYDNYSGDGNVLDFSSGYGGRLMGALTSDKVLKYTGTDPCVKSYEALDELIDFLQRIGYVTPPVNTYRQPFEDVDFPKGEYDLSFSSPPYFNTEEYDYEDTQSFIRYPTQELWRDKFLTPLIKKNHELLKHKGNFVINVASVKTYPDLEKDTVSLAQEAGFTLTKTYKMALSSLMKGGFKYEPIFVFQKQ